MKTWLQRLPYPKLLVKKIYFAYRYKAKIESPLISFDSVLGEGVVIKSGSVISHSQIGQYSYLNFGVEVYRSDIEAFCSLGQSCQIGPNEHLLNYITTCEALYSPKVLDTVNTQNQTRTQIGPDVWVGAKAIVLKGRKVGVGAVIAAGAVVTTDVPPYAIIAGVPAKVIHYRFSQAEIALLIQSKWWQVPAGNLIKILQQVDYYDKKCNVQKFCQLVTESNILQ